MSKTLLERRDDAYQAAKSLHSEFDENPTDEQLTQLKSALDVVEELDEKIANIAQKNSATQRLKSLVRKDPGEEVNNVKAKSLGEHFVKEAAEVLAKQANGSQINFSGSEFAPDMKAAEDPQLRPANLSEGWGTFYDRTIVNQKREELIAADLMGHANVSLPTIKYLVEKFARIAEGGAGTVAEGSKKPYVRYADFDVVTESLTKVAVLTKLSDEMIEDYGFVSDWINSQLIYDLSVTEEEQLLAGDGTGSNILGLLNRSGIQTMTSTAATADVWFDDIYKAFDLVSAGSPLKADGLIINDLDYQVLRLAKDSNGQYYGGGPFAGAYNVGGIIHQPPVWAKRTVPTTSVPRGTALAGAFKQGAITLRKNGLRVDSTNTNVDDFERNVVTFRAEERLGLMTPIPSAFVKMNLNGVEEGA